MGSDLPGASEPSATAFFIDDELPDLRGTLLFMLNFGRQQSGDKHPCQQSKQMAFPGHSFIFRDDSPQ
jgi:hypothetical protein